VIPISYNVRSLLVRKTTTAATAFGIALVVFVMAGSLMLAMGVQKTMVSAGSPDNAIVLRKGSDTEMASGIEMKNVVLILAAPGVKKDSTGAPLGAGESVVVITVDKLGSGGQVSNVQVRGVPPSSLLLRSESRVIEGRPPKPGTDEVIIGKGLVGRFAGMELNGHFELKKNRPVTVVGIFESGGSSFESEVWADLDTVRTSFGREGNVSSVTVRLDSPLKFDTFKANMESDKQLGLEAMREDAYYRKQSEGTSIFIGAMGAVIAFFASFGAIVGALITMLAAVAQRQREIGTLRALGFSRFAILSSFLVEATILALGGGLFGVLCASLLAFVEVPMMNFATWQEVTFQFDPNPLVLTVALVFGAGIGIVGGFFPALRAARVSPINAMRA
jgi:putative ABC transport system permease protein